MWSNKNKKGFESFTHHYSFTKKYSMNRRIIYLCVALLPFLLSNMAMSQMNNDHQVSLRTEEAKKLMNDGQYEFAYNAFRKILNSGKVLPTNLSYYFSNTLYHLGQFKNSQNFVDKYLKITGKGGDYYQEANELSKLLAKEFDEINTCSYCDISGYRLTLCSNCNGRKSVIESCHICNSTGIHSCKKCEGEGVIIVTDVFDEKKYQTCDKCLGEGFHTCETCLGTTSLRLNCPVCLGSGFERSKNLCDHEDHTLD
jgi:DnaJ-class molecular chaperone